MASPRRHPLLQFCTPHLPRRRQHPPPPTFPPSPSSPFISSSTPAGGDNYAARAADCRPYMVLPTLPEATTTGTIPTINNRTTIFLISRITRILRCATPLPGGDNHPAGCLPPRQRRKRRPLPPFGHPLPRSGRGKYTPSPEARHTPPEATTPSRGRRETQGLAP